MSSSASDPSCGLGRRVFMQGGALFMAGLTAGAVTAEEKPSVLRIGLMTDMHYADKLPVGSRYYQETLTKLGDAAHTLADKKLDFLVELGDFIDAADSVETEKRYLKTIAKPFAEICSERHYVLGNHCVDTLTKDEFLGGVEQEKSYYSFDRGPCHFVVLDACFRSDGKAYGRKNSVWTDANIPQAELDWLADDLQKNNRKTIVFAHQRLDTEGNHAVNNSAEVRKILEQAGNVAVVFQGHSHANDYRSVNDIHYCTLRAMIERSGVENNGFSILDVAADGTCRLSGFRQQESYQWT